MSLLEVKDLKTYFYTDSGVAKAVDGVTFSLDKGKTLGIVGIRLRQKRHQPVYHASGGPCHRPERGRQHRL